MATAVSIVCSDGTQVDKSAIPFFTLTQIHLERSIDWGVASNLLDSGIDVMRFEMRISPRRPRSSIASTPVYAAWRKRPCHAGRRSREPPDERKLD